MFKELFDYLYHQAPAGGIPLKGTGIVLGLALIAKHLWAYLNTDAAQTFLKQFPRHFGWGAALLTIDFVWAMLLLTYMDMGEFFFLRKWFLIIVPVSYVLVLTNVREFLAVRALGSLMLLIAGPVLTAAFLQPPVTRLLLSVLAYVWIIVGMFFIGMPFLMRDWVAWVSANAARWRLATLGGVAYGAAILVAALMFW